jgi:uncharacterized membrane protein
VAFFISIQNFFFSRAQPCRFPVCLTSLRVRVRASKGARMPVSTQSGLSDNAAGAISYFTFIPAIVFLIAAPYNANSYIRFHSWQSILLCVAAFIVNVAVDMLSLVLLSGFFWIARLASLLWFVVWLICVVQAFNGNRFKLPVIGDIAEKLSAK